MQTSLRAFAEAGCRQQPPVRPGLPTRRRCDEMRRFKRPVVRGMPVSTDSTLRAGQLVVGQAAFFDHALQNPSVAVRGARSKWRNGLSRVGDCGSAARNADSAVLRSAGLLAEIMPRRLRAAEVEVAVIEAVQVRGENLVLGPNSVRAVAPGRLRRASSRRCAGADDLT